MEAVYDNRYVSLCSADLATPSHYTPPVQDASYRDSHIPSGTTPNSPLSKLHQFCTCYNVFVFVSTMMHATAEVTFLQFFAASINVLISLVPNHLKHVEQNLGILLCCI